MADPLRVRLLETLVVSPSTVADLAARVGEPAGRLYHHLDLLLEAGLIEVVGRRQKRGTEQRTFRAVAKDYGVAESLFQFGSGNDETHEALVELGQSTFHGLADDLAGAARAGRIDPRRPAGRVFLETQELRLSERDFTSLCDALDQWISEAKARGVGKGRGKRRYRLGAAFFPLAIAAGFAVSRPTTMAGQTARAKAEASITPESIRRSIDLIAHDSMLGRATPSRGLDLTAAYLADRFREAGIRPLGDSGTYLQRYPLVRRRLAPEKSILTLSGPGVDARLPFGSRLAFAQGTMPSGPIGGRVILLGGAVDPTAIVADSVRGRLVIWLVDVTGPGAAAIDGVAGALIGGGPVAVVLVPNDTGLVRSAAAGQSQEQIARPGTQSSGFSAFAADEGLLAGAVRGWDPVFRRLRATRSTAWVSTPLEATVSLATTTLPGASAPNVVGLIRGSDPALAGEYVLLSAHMDHIGVSSGATPDSINNGADDNGSGTVAVLHIARAMAMSGVGPRRSILVAIVSGEERGLWGSEYLVSHPPVPLDSVVADVNLDMVGRNWRDTVGVIGRQHSNLGQILDQVAAAHPELRVKPVGDRWPDQNRFYRSDHYNFARAGIPILFLSSGYAPEYHQVGDSPDKIDSEKLARLARLVFHFGLELADRADRPSWVPASRKEIVVRPAR
jgi:DNA-binding transcriptional ArsR family regulator